MARANPLQPSFARGEISPLLYGRVDLAPYAVSVKTLENAIVRLQGPVTRRSGTRFVNETRDSTRKARLYNFEFSTTQAYILEFGNLYFRIFKDEGIITQTAQAITGITQANPAVLTYSGADTYANGDRVVISGVSGMVQVNNREFTVANVNAGANTFELQGLDSTGFTAYASGGTVAEIVDVTTTFLETDLYALKFAQSADTLYIAHPSYKPKKITRTSHTSWTIADIVFTDGPYLDINTTATTLALSGTTGSVTVTASATTGINGGTGFASTDVGRLIRWKDPANNWTWLTITGFTSTTVVTATISGPNASAGTATVNWRLGSWSTTTGYPGAVTFYEQRLWWGGNTNQPQTVWASRSNDFENMAPSDPNGTVTDSHAIQFTMGANQVNVIRWLHPGQVLQIGTVGGMWIVRSSTLDDPLTPTNVQTRRQRSVGSANIQPVEAGDATLFITRSGRKARELAYSFERDKYVAPDVTIFAEHILKGGVTNVAYAQEPDPVLWCVRNDGVLAALTYERDQEVVGWHRHTIGGEFAGDDSVVESVAVIPSPDGSHDQLWLTVKRTINGTTKRYVEFMEQNFADTDVLADAFFVDSGLTYSGTATTVVTGLFHLEGQTVSVLADGAAHPDKVVSGGQITLDRSASKVHAGLMYDTDVESLRIEAGASIGTAQGQTKRIHGVTLRLLNTLGCKIGPNENALDEMLFRLGSDPMDQPPPLFSGDKYIAFDDGYNVDGRVFIRQDQPLPFTLQAIMPRLVTNER